jgi:hypothetical protein
LKQAFRLLLTEVTLVSTGEHHLILTDRQGRQSGLGALQPQTDMARFATTRNEYAWDRIESADNPKFSDQIIHWLESTGASPEGAEMELGRLRRARSGVNLRLAQARQCTCLAISNV